MAKPKAKSGIDNNLLSQMLKQAEVTNHALGQPAAAAEPVPAATPAEAVAAEAVPVASEATPPPAAGLATAGVGEGQKEEPASAAPAPAVASPAAPQPAPVAAAAVPPAPAAAATTAPVPETEATPEAAPAGAGEEASPANYDLASLFIPTGEKKTFSLRITDRHYQYLLLLGATVGGGASPPDIVYNLVEQFMDQHDPLVQKAIQKNMRQRQHAAKKR